MSVGYVVVLTTQLQLFRSRSNMGGSPSVDLNEVYLTGVRLKRRNGVAIEFVIVLQPHEEFI
jgi:hypothetical protein